MNKLWIQIASPSYRDKLVAEIWFGDIHVAEINQDSEDLEIEIFDLERIKVPLKDFQAAIETAIKELAQ